LVKSLLLPQNKTEIEYCFSSSNRWSNRVTKSNPQTLYTSLLQL
jgi:hypothetical protein